MSEGDSMNNANRNERKRPNVLLITTDQHHFTDIGIHNPKVKTPNLDRLAAEGFVCDRMYCPNPTCTPTRASLITGLYPSQHGAWSLGTKLLDSVPTIGDELQRHGFRTALIGKAHFEPLKSTDKYKSLESYPIMQDADFWKGFTGPYYGFEYIQLARNHTDEAHVGQHYRLWLEENGCDNWKDYFMKPTGKKTYIKRKNLEPLWRIPEKYHYNVWIAEKSNLKLEEYAKNGDNFFLWASFLDPHRPRIAPDPWHKMYDPADIDLPERKKGEHKRNPPHFGLTQVNTSNSNFLVRWWKGLTGSLKSIKLKKYYQDFRDHGVKMQGLHGMHPQFYNEENLKKEIAAYYGMTSLLDKYIGVILDKLEELGLKDNTIVVFTTDHGDFFGQHGLLTKGPFHYEDLLKLPFIVRYPKSIPRGQISDALESLIDIPATLFSMLNIPKPDYMVGVDQSDVWTAKAKRKREFIICENHHSPELVHLKTYVNDRYKITVYNDQTYGELFDLQEDPNENENLWDNKKYQQLKDELLFEFIQAEISKDYAYCEKKIIKAKKNTLVL